MSVKQWFRIKLPEIVYKPQTNRIATSLEYEEIDFAADYSRGANVYGVCPVLHLNPIKHTDGDAMDGCRPVIQYTNNGRIHATKEGILSDNLTLVEVLESIEDALYYDRIEEYATSATKLFPHTDDCQAIPLYLLVARLKALYAVYLAYRIIVWQDRQVTLQDIKQVYNAFGFLEEERRLDAIHRKEEYQPEKAVSEHAQLLELVKHTMGYYPASAPQTVIVVKVGKIQEKRYCDSLYTALLYQLTSHIVQGDNARYKTTLKTCAVCGKSFVSLRKNNTLCEVCSDPKLKMRRSRAKRNMTDKKEG